MNLIQRIAEHLTAGTPIVVATIVEVVGSSPRKPGSRMIVFLDGSIEGTIGGGALENKVIQDALQSFTDSKNHTRTYDLTRELGMCCGGRLEIFFEVFAGLENLFIFGAGHIAKPLAAFASQAGFKVSVIDEREEYLNEARFPDVSSRLLLPPEDSIPTLPFDERTFVAICTHDHILDQRIVEFCLGKPFKYLGLIGSRTKAAKTRARLKAQGFGDDEISKLHSPMGMNIGGQTPTEISISILAEMIATRYSFAVTTNWEKKLKNESTPIMMAP